MVEKLKGINGIHPYNSNTFNNVHGHMIFLDQIQEYPKICVIAGDEARQYQPGEFKGRFLNLENFWNLKRFCWGIRGFEKDFY